MEEMTLEKIEESYYTVLEQYENGYLTDADWKIFCMVYNEVLKENFKETLDRLKNI